MRLPLGLGAPLGFATCDQLCPSQCSITICWGANGNIEKPTAHASLWLNVATDISQKVPSCCVPLPRLGYSVHACPSQCSVSVSSERALGSCLYPTAHTSFGASADTPYSTPAGLPVGTVNQTCPSQWSVSGLSPSVPPPTAHTLSFEIAARPSIEL